MIEIEISTVREYEAFLNLILNNYLFYGETHNICDYAKIYHEEILKKLKKLRAIAKVVLFHENDLRVTENVVLSDESNLRVTENVVLSDESDLRVTEIVVLFSITTI